MVAKAGTTVHTSVTSRKPSRGCSSRRCRPRVAKKVKSPATKVTRNPVSNAACAPSASARENAMGTKKAGEKSSTAPESTCSTGKKRSTASRGRGAGGGGWRSGGRGIAIA